MVICVKNTAKEAIGETKSSMPVNEETWGDEKIQITIAREKKDFILWQKSSKRLD